MRVLVTGGTGYVGRFIVEAMLREGFEVIVAGRQPPEPDLFSAPIAFRPLDLDPDADRTALLEGIDWLVHGAFDHVEGKYRGGEGDDPARFSRLNRDGSIALFKTAKAGGVKRAVFLSSRAVYGTQGAPTLLTEATPARPETLYGQVKLDGERALSALASAEFVAASLRITGVYGAHRSGASHKWEKLFADFLDGQTIAPRVATEVHGFDVAQAVLLLLRYTDINAIAGRVFNVSDILLDQHDLLGRVAALSGIERQPPDPADRTSVDVMDCTVLKKLGWRPGGFDLLEETLPDLIRPR
ncbi:NAD(P)-dependent oxidoreductase [Rhizobium sp. EC-SD404]|uniref:NAD-dependent epimerase/dehydratase family protein n=1 Tax=Rhizobium sp. EC-SD404 TaxID=2038389 RepID=UPI00125AF490|nr:NAD(P)-dependent oxidoreductase [Rhizobium sp. EC-SD404]VVT06509.1 Nucleoside-diphosphate-sugar epimerase [Rhizobium sp. EC-SD404]